MSNGAPFGIRFGSALVMPGSRFFAVSDGVSRRIATSPAVMPIYGVGQFRTRVFAYVGNEGSEFGDIQECLDPLDLTSCENRSEVAVGGC